MNNSFLIGDIITHNINKTLQYLDSEDEREQGESHTLISPIIHFPVKRDEYCGRWVTYRRTSCEPMFSKDGLHIDKVSFEINVACASYIDSISAATLIRELFDGARMLSNSSEDEEPDLFMRNVRLVNAEEAFDYDMYVQTMEFTCEVHSTQGSHLQQLKDAEEEQYRTTTEED
jgi:hypothetical protein